MIVCIDSKLTCRHQTSPSDSSKTPTHPGILWREREILLIQTAPAITHLA